MSARQVSNALLALVAVVLWSGAAAAQESVKIGLILPMTGQQASTGRQIEAAARLFMQQNGAKVAGKTVEFIVKDDTGMPDVSKRIAQELIVNDKVAFLAGFGLTPIALAVAPLATQAKVPEVVMAAGTSTITEASPYIVRTSFTLAAGDRADGRLGPEERHQEGRDARLRLWPRPRRREGLQRTRYKGGGARSRQPQACRSPTPISRPSCRRSRTLKPDALFVFVPSGSGARFMKQFLERGLDKSGIA